MKSPIVIALALALLGGCDTGYGSFLNTVPVAEQPREQPVEVFLGIDGLSRASFDQARAGGAFAGWSAADLVTFFPGVSDYSWMRLLRAGTMPGYEIQYFDPDRNTLVASGLAGLAEHPLHEGLLDPLPSYASFDFLGDGDLWLLRGYTDPEAALPSTLDALFSTLATRGRIQPTFRAYLLNVDVVAHHGGFARAVAMLVEIDRRIREFQDRHPGRFRFTILADHGNAHLRATLIDPRDLLRQVGVTPVESFGPPGALEAVPIVHVRVNFVSVHTRPEMTEEVAARTSRHPWVDLTAAVLPAAGPLPRFALFRSGERFVFSREPDGTVVVPDAAGWRALGVELARWTEPASGAARIPDREAFEATRQGPYPDLFHRVATAFTDPTVRYPPTLILSLRDDVASFGFHLPGTGDSLAVDGFHGALSRASTLSVVASQGRDLPPAVRADDLGALLPGLQR
jgi:hypothetical protein